MAAGRRLIRPDKELEGRREGDGLNKVRRERGGQGQFGAHNTHTQTLEYMLVLCSTSMHENKVLIMRVFLLESTLTAAHATLIRWLNCCM